MGIFACLGHFFLILSLKYADASKLAPFGYFEIFTNIILGYYFFSDFPDFWMWIGLLIIISSGIYISIRERSRGVIYHLKGLRSLVFRDLYFNDVWATVILNYKLYSLQTPRISFIPLLKVLL